MPCLLKTEGMTLLQSVLTSDSARMNQNVAVSIRGMCQILAKEFLCKMVVHKFSESIFSSTRQICPVNREHQNHEGDLPFEVHSLSVGVFQPMGHLAQKMKLGAKHNKSKMAAEDIEGMCWSAVLTGRRREGLAVLSPGGDRARIKEQKWCP